jgi:hypothetical protein
MQKENNESLTEESITVTYYQWIKGDNTGDVVSIKDTDDKWVNFNEGGRLAKELKDEFIQPLDTNIANEFITTNIEVIPPAVAIPVAVNITTSLSPIRVLFDKQKKNDRAKLLLDFPLNIPPKSIYELMSTSFDKDEVDEQLFSFMLDQLSQEEITKCLLDGIKSLIQSKYKDE